jgi:hypothetical protein
MGNVATIHADHCFVLKVESGDVIEFNKYADGSVFMRVQDSYGWGFATLTKDNLVELGDIIAQIISELGG